MKPSKCQIAVSECTYMYMGNVAGSGRVPSVKDKLETIRSCPELRHVTDK